MIISIEPHAPVLPAADCDEIGPALEFRLSSGNACVVTPSSNLLDSGERAVSVVYAWEREPNIQDQADVEVKVQSVLGDPVFMTDLLSDDELAKVRETQDDWLAHGTIPDSVRRKQ